MYLVRLMVVTLYASGVWSVVDCLVARSCPPLRREEMVSAQPLFRENNTLTGVDEGGGVGRSTIPSVG